jgi:hypothetical protein
MFSGKNNYGWKGDNAKYFSYHNWLKLHYGRPKKCESPTCNGKSKNFHWAIKKGFHHSHNRKNYLRLCVSCHRKYDMTPEIKKRILKTLKKAIGWNTGLKRRHDMTWIRK